MSQLKVIWEDGALQFLMDRDRFTRQDIQEEFRRDPEHKAIALDLAHDDYLTPVSNNRFTVVWHKDSERRQAIVRAVVPLPNVDEKSAGLREYVQRAVDAATKR